MQTKLFFWTSANSNLMAFTQVKAAHPLRRDADGPDSNLNVTYSGKYGINASFKKCEVNT